MIYVSINRSLNRKNKKLFFDENDISYVDEEEIVLKNGKSIPLRYSMNCILNILEGKTENKLIIENDFGIKNFQGSSDDAILFFLGKC